MNPAILTQHDPVAPPRLGRSVTIDQAALLLSVSRRTVYYRIREGRLRTIRTLGGSQRVLIESMLEQERHRKAYSAQPVAEDSTCQPR